MEIEYSVIVMDKTVISSKFYVSGHEDWKEELIKVVEGLRTDYGTWANIHVSLSGE